MQRNILGKKVVQGEVEFQGFVHTLRYLARTHGMRALFRGSLARVMFHTPSTAITMALYDHSARLWSDVLTS